MIFQSIEFLIFFVAVLIGVKILWKVKYQHLFLLLSSYYFYFLTSNIAVFLLVILTLAFFYFGNCIYYANNLKQKQIFLAISVSIALGILGFFKYYNFGIENLNNLAFFCGFSISIMPIDLILPIGISFYTFTGLSYIFDIYSGTLRPSERLYKFALLIAYFPHLLAGPIVRASQFLPQLTHKLGISSDNLKFGITLIFWGLVKKIAIADNLAPIVDATFSDPLGKSSFTIIFGTFLFGIQIFCDFSGYCDIALGVAQIIGLRLPVNFLRPYLAQNPTEFWRRWNITLSFFIRDYIYIPLGGNRKGKVRSYVNQITAMLLCGLWHGAAWSFVIWGFYHGILLSVHKIVSKEITLGKTLNTLLQSAGGNFLKIIITQYFIFLGWLFFRVQNLSDLTYCFGKFVWIDWDLTPNQKISIVLLIISIGLIFILLQNKKIASWIVSITTRDWVEYFSSLSLNYWVGYLICALMILLFFAPTSNPEFIYFQF